MYISHSSKIPGQPRDELQWEEEEEDILPGARFRALWEGVRCTLRVADRWLTVLVLLSPFVLKTLKKMISF